MKRVFLVIIAAWALVLSVSSCEKDGDDEKLIQQSIENEKVKETDI